MLILSCTSFAILCIVFVQIITKSAPPFSRFWAALTIRRVASSQLPICCNSSISLKSKENIRPWTGCRPPSFPLYVFDIPYSIIENSSFGFGLCLETDKSRGRKDGNHDHVQIDSQSTVRQFAEEWQRACCVRRALQWRQTLLRWCIRANRRSVHRTDPCRY